MLRLSIYLSAFLVTSLSAQTLTSQKIQEVRGFVHYKSSVSEQIRHYAATLRMLQLIAAEFELDNPLTERPIENAEDKDAVWCILDETIRFLTPYGEGQPSLKDIDSCNPTPRQRAAMLDRIRLLLDNAEILLIDKHIENQTRPLREELRKELGKGTMTYVDRAGIQRNAIPERAVTLLKSIEAIEAQKAMLLKTCSQLYRNARIELLIEERECDFERAVNITDAWLARQHNAYIRAREAEQRKTEQQTKLEKLHQERKKQQVSRPPTKR